MHCNAVSGQITLLPISNETLGRLCAGPTQWLYKHQYNYAKEMLRRAGMLCSENKAAMRTSFEDSTMPQLRILSSTNILNVY
jgi:hypothetical protein